MIAYAGPPDLLIYLKAKVGKLLEQIEKRGRPFERSIPVDYLKTLNVHYDEWIHSYQAGKLLVVDVNQIDLVNRSEGFANIVNNIDLELKT